MDRCEEDEKAGEEIGMIWEALYKLYAIVEAEARKLMHDKTDLVVRSVQPILWLVVFGEVFSKLNIIPTGGYSYLQFVAPGILGQSVLFVAIFFGIMMVWDRESGVLSKLLISPISRFSIVLGKALSAGVRGVAQASVLMVIELLIGIQFYPNIFYTLAVFPVIILLAALFASLSIVIANLVKTRERVMGFGQLITMPLFFTSNALYPASIMPAWLQYISMFNPLTYGVDLLRALLLTGNLANAWVDLAVILGYLLVFTLIGARLMKNVME
jgi:ABC-2 type transport system permease protein